MNATALWILLTVLGAAPPPGTYEVVQDQFRAEKKEWGLFCGQLPNVKTSPQGTPIQLSVAGDRWVFSGANRYFGSQICEGTLPHLGVTQRKTLGETGVQLECATRRVTRGTERTTQTIRLRPDGNVELQIDGALESRKDGDLCQATFAWRTVLRPKTLAGVEKSTAQTSPDSSNESDVEKPGKARNSKRKSSAGRSCKKPGRAVELELEPDSFVANEASPLICVKATARDAQGCRVKIRKTKVKYSVSPKGAGRVNGKGCLQLSPSFKTGGDVTVAARYKKLKGLARIRTGDKSRSIDIRLPRASAPGSVQDPSVTPAPQPTATAAAASTAARVKDQPLAPVAAPEVEGGEESGLPVGPLFGLAIVCVGGGVALGLRHRRNAAMAEVLEQFVELEVVPTSAPAGVGEMNTPLSSQNGIRYCAKCGSEFASGGAETCPIDGEVLSWRERRVPEVVTSVPPSGTTVCPICFTRYDGSTSHCLRDGTPLVSDYGQFND